MVMHQPYNEKVDLWCLGILTFEFLVGKPPFETDDANSTYRKIMAVEYNVPSYVSDLAKEFIAQLLQKKPEQRMSLENAKVHPWISTYAKDRKDKHLV